MASDLRVVGVFPTAVEASLAQGYLGEEGIESHVEAPGGLIWLGGEMPLTGVRLMVGAEHLERAMQVLDASLGTGRGVVEAFVDDEELTLEAQRAAAAGGAEVETEYPEREEESAQVTRTDIHHEERVAGAVLRAKRGMAAALLGLTLLGPIFSAVGLAIFAELATQDRWGRLPVKLRWLVAVSLGWCVAGTALGFVLLAAGARWWWLSGWL